MQRLKNGKIDIAIYPIVQGEKLPIEFEVDKLYKHKDFMVVPKSHPLANKKELEKEDFKEYPYFLMDKFTFYDPRTALEFGEPNIKIENSTWEIIFSLLKNNLGITAMTGEVFDRYKNVEKFFVKREIDHFFPDIYYSLISKNGFTNKKAIVFLIDRIKKFYNNK